MQAHEALQQIFKQSGWSMSSAKLSAPPPQSQDASSQTMPVGTSSTTSANVSRYDSLLMQAHEAYRVELSNMILDLACFNNDEIFCSCQVLTLPQSEEQKEHRANIIRQACTMNAVANMGRMIKLVLHDDLLCLELNINVLEDDFITTLSRFLDDCDYFCNNLAAASSSSSSSAIASKPSQDQLSKMSPSLQYFLGVTT